MDIIYIYIYIFIYFFFVFKGKKYNGWRHDIYVFILFHDHQTSYTSRLPEEYTSYSSEEEPPKPPPKVRWPGMVKQGVWMIHGVSIHVYTMMIDY